MTVRLIGFQCRNGDQCHPGHPARPVWQGEEFCWPCFALGRVVEGIKANNLECVVCGTGDLVGGEVQPVFGAGLEDRPGSGHAALPEPLMFCRECAEAMHKRQEAYKTATAKTTPIDSLEVQWQAQFGDEEAA